MPSFILTDTAHDVWLEQFSLTAAELHLPAEPGWSVAKRRLRGGRRDGVDLVELDNGALRMAIVPTRGMGLWKGQYRADPIGWHSPVTDGPVHPAFVNQSDRGGLGWLEGFDELMVRCGLGHNGAPYVETDSSGRPTVYGLHGRIANIPAHYVAVHVEDAPPHTITIEGHVDEAWLFGPQIRLVTTIRTIPGSNRLTVRDTFYNLKDSPCDMQVLYHWNFGPPHLEEGSRFLAPIAVVCSRNERASEGIGHFDTYGAPEKGFAEQVYFFQLLGRGSEGKTLTLLRNRAGDKGVALRFATSQLPCFTLWKNTGALKEGYVTGLEPAVNYPNPTPFEKARKRVQTLLPGSVYANEVTLEIWNEAAGVHAAAQEIQALQAHGTPTIHQKPVEPFAAES